MSGSDPDRVSPPLIRRVVLRNYRSIKSCSVDLSPLTVVVGRNAAGKSNFVDAIRFVRDALTNQLEFALRERGGIDEVRRRAVKSKPPNFSIELDIQLPDGDARYGFTIAPVAGRQFEVAEEKCIVRSSKYGSADFSASRGQVTWYSLTGDSEPLFGQSPASPFAAAEDRLFLMSASSHKAFRQVYENLTGMVFHNLNADAMKRPQKPERGDQLAADGHNIASVIKELSEGSPDRKKRVLEYLNAIGVGVTDFCTRAVAGYETVEFTQLVPGTERTWKFDSSAMSDGTMRSLGILVSLLGARNGKGRGPTLVAVEEPETALHPAASGALFDAISEAAQSTQVIVTCHSPDLLDQRDLPADSIVVAVLDEQGTRLGKLSEAKRALLNSHLQTAGDLLRLDQLTPDPKSISTDDRAWPLFGEDA